MEEDIHRFEDVYCLHVGNEEIFTVVMFMPCHGYAFSSAGSMLISKKLFKIISPIIYTFIIQIGHIYMHVTLEYITIVAGGVFMSYGHISSSESLNN
jgi:hypothetical protein